MFVPCSITTTTASFVISTFRQWDKEPNTDTPNTDCAMIAYGASMFMRRCDMKLGFICERPASGVSKPINTSGNGGASSSNKQIGNHSGIIQDQ